MEESREKPDWVIRFDRPQGTEIKHINGRWYLYERLSVYNPETKKKRKKSGKLLGTITSEGFIPKRERLPDCGLEGIVNLEYGASAFLFQRAQQMAERLEPLFPGIWKEILALAIIKCKDDAPFKRVSYHYETSYLSHILGRLDLGASTITSLLKRIGTDRDAIATYMRQDLAGKERIILFDGHRVISSSRTMEYAQLGYDSRMRFMPQINLMYLFSVDDCTRMPLFYKQFAGSVPDCIAFTDIGRDAELQKGKVTVIGDKGFASEDNFDSLAATSLPYIIPLKRGSLEIKGEIPQTPEKYGKVFTCRERSIYCQEYFREGYNVFLYYDMALANDETSDAVIRLDKRNAVICAKAERERRRKEKGHLRLSEAELKDLTPVDVASVLQGRKELGTFMLKTTRVDLNCSQVYMLYKTRQEIEQSFKAYDNTLDSSASYMRDHYSFEAWLFINHLALQLLYDSLDVIAKSQKTNQYSFDDLMAHLKGVRINKMDKTWMLTKITKKTTAMCESIGITLPNPADRAP